MHSQKIGLICLCLTVMVALCNAECCGPSSVPVFGGCNGKGACNFFCCNCDNGCASYPYDKKGGKHVLNPAQIFKSADKNKNGAIDFDEALKFAAKKGGNKVQLKKDRKWFTSIDKNHDGVIKPNEFDKTLKN
uniref:EF-hand domain-containing protein n=1 Tax=Panagrolaimus superbus TaxID=310955 RepID=A0A914YIF1_9BILA